MDHSRPETIALARRLGPAYSSRFPLDSVVELGDGEHIATRTLLWTAGTSSNPLLGHLPCEKNLARLIVDDTLAVKDWQDVWPWAIALSFPTPDR